MKVFMLRNIITLCLLASNLYSQTTLRGFVKDSLSNEALIGSYIILDNKVTETDANGYFEIHLPENRNLLFEVHQIGYKILYQSLSALDLNNIMTFKLSPIIITEVVITSSKNKIPLSQIGVVKIASNEIKKLASFAGEPDVLQALQFKSGFQPTSEGISGVVARGGLPDQNLLLVNGVRIYNYAHVFGFLSFINGEMIKDVTVYKSGFHGRYGGRSSSIIDMTLYDGNTNKIELDATLGTLTSKFTIKAPIIKDKWGFSFGARAANLGVVNFFSGKNYDQKESANKVNINIHDFTFNTKYRLSPTSTFSSFVIKSSDRIEVKSKYGYINEDTRFSGWSNLVAGLNFFKIFPNSIKFEISMGFLDYKNYFAEKITRENVISQNSSLSSGLNELSFQKTLTKYFNNNISSSIGISYYRTNIRTLNIAEIKDTIILPNKKQTNFNIFTTINTEIKKFKSEASLRYDIYDKNISKGIFQPRVHATLLLNDKASMHVSYDAIAQNAFQVPAFNNSPPLDIWIPINTKFGLNNSQQISIGGNYKTKNNWVYGIEFFYKKQKNIIDNTVVYTGITNGAVELDNTLGYDGKLKAYGVELECNISFKKITIETSYTYTDSKISFSGIQQGNQFRTNFLRPHSFKMNLNFAASKKWNIFLKSIWMSGQPFTAAINAFYDDANQVNYIYGNRNNGTYPSYFRTDIGANYSKSKKSTFSIHIYNITAKRNPFYIYLKEIPYTGEPNYSSSGYFDSVLYTILPSISYSIKIL